MSARPKDHRPRVISLSTSLDRLNIAAKQNVLWPCHAFSISLPQKKKSGLNIFEQTVLKLTEIEFGDTEKIATIACLYTDNDGKKPLELLSFIQNRLHSLGLVDARYKLTKEGIALLENWQNNSEGNVEYTAATVFVDLLNGKLLPYVHVGELKQLSIIDIDGEFITVNTGSTGKSKAKRCRQIHPGKGSYWKTFPNSNDIIKAIREFKKKYQRHALLSKAAEQYPPRIPLAEAISVNDNPELVYLHCIVLIQIGNSDLLVTDGCGLGFSESFARYLQSQDWKWVTEFKQKGVFDKIGSDPMQTYRPLDKSFKHREISRRLSSCKKSIQRLNRLEINNSHYESDYRNEIEKGIKNLYAALEWAFRQIVTDFPVSEWENIFSSQNFRENEKLLYAFAEKIGFSVTDKNKSILQVKPGAIRQIENGSVVLQPLLALSLAGANSNYIHPLHSLAENHSGFLSFALKLKRYRDPIEHGSEIDIDKDILNELIEDTIAKIISLIPGVADDLNIASTGIKDSQSDVNQERLKADIELEKALGLPFVSELLPRMKEELIRVEIMLAQFSDDKSIEIIKCLAAVMQLALFEVVVNRKPSTKTEGDIRDKAIMKIVESGFYSSAASIPVEISTVNIRQLHSVVQGSSSTLGAHLLAIFLLGSESELIQLKKYDFSFIDFVANLISPRGHGNKQLYGLSLNDIESLKYDVFKAIKMIPEVF